MRNISFGKLEISPREIRVEATVGEESFPLWYKFDREVKVSADSVALALSTLCGTKYDAVEFGFEVPAEVLETVRAFTKAEVSAWKETESPRTIVRGDDSVVLSFSGGMDSLAAKYLAPCETHLVSLDFGGYFQREAEFFKRFDTLVVETNIRREPDHKTALARNHWLFMASGAILTQEYFQSGYHAFGTILGNAFSRERFGTPRHLPLIGAGYQDFPIVTGVTEIGAAKAILEATPELMPDIIESLAGKRDRKHYLKIALARYMAERLGIEADIPQLPADWKWPVDFNNSYTTALAALAFIAKGKGEMIAPIFTSIPDSAVELAKGFSLDFVEKVDLNRYGHLPPGMEEPFKEKLAEYNFEPYSEEDYREAEVVRSYLNSLFGKE